MGWAPGWHLNSNGKQQVEKLARRLQHLPIRAVYTSPLERALETAEPIARTRRLAPIPMQDLGELHFGEWEGLTMAELECCEQWKRFNVYRSGTRCPGGELMVEAQMRMVQRLNCLCGTHPGEMVAVVSHGDPLRSVIAHHLGISLDLLQRFEISPASVSIVEAGEWGPRLLCLNQMGELPV